MLVFGLAAQWLAWRLRIPAILLLLVLGFGCGVCFGDPGELLGPDLFLAIVSLSVAVILFEGGLESPAGRGPGNGPVCVIALVTVGIAVTWLLTAGAAIWILDFSWPMGGISGRDSGGQWAHGRRAVVASGAPEPANRCHRQVGRNPSTTRSARFWQSSSSWPSAAARRPTPFWAHWVRLSSSWPRGRPSVPWWRC